VGAGQAGLDRARLEAEIALALGPETAAGIAAALAGAPAGRHTVVTARHGTRVAYSATTSGRRRVAEVDRHGTLLTVLRWSPGGGLDAGWLRLPDRSWVVVEPRARDVEPWGPCDRLGRAERLGETGAPLTLVQSVEHAAPRTIPVVIEPARLPPGAGSAVLNLLAGLAADQGIATLAYAGPYPTEQLFLSLLESFRYTPGSVDPLADFVAGRLAWQPDPHERVLAGGEAWVHLRGRIEKVAWGGRTYVRAGWQGVERHAPRRVRDDGAAVRCSLWALGAAVEDHLELTPAGDLVRSTEPPRPGGEAVPLPPAVARGVVAAVAATSAPALAPVIRELGAALALEWGPVDGDLVAIAAGRARIALGVRDRLASLLNAARGAEGRAGVALAAVGEIAQLVGDDLRARAARRLLALAPAEQEALLSSPPPAAGETDAGLITGAVQALLAGVT